jgi:hypothetical protein
MQDPILEQMRQWLPELFGTAGKATKPGGMCTPGSGCLPAAENAANDILEVLTASGAAPPAEKDTGGKEVRNEDAD